jgi:hypothetical protein
MTAMFSLKDVAKQLGLQGYQIQHAYITGAVPEPKLRIGGRRVFEPAYVRRLAKHFNVTLKADAAVAAETAE